MSVLLASSDLAIVSLATGAAGRQQVELQVAMSAAALAAALEAKTFKLVIFDLGLASLDVTQAMQQLRQSPSCEAATIAFGPHVQESLLAAARSAGCNRILSRGQFLAQIGEILEGARGE
ncbi:MAG TPA: hypothetical protein VG433_13365 [Pirellulales bacterium]|nr:hypothetical protein [Pirellulales bacterium]